MRIAGDIPHPEMKITVFVMNGRYSIKFEKKLLEQTYKFRDGVFESARGCINAVTPKLISEVSDLFDHMHRVQFQPGTTDEDQFPEII